jgi:hypothetical protein
VREYEVGVILQQRNRFAAALTHEHVCACGGHVRIWCCGWGGCGCDYAVPERRCVVNGIVFFESQRHMPCVHSRVHTLTRA